MIFINIQVNKAKQIFFSFIFSYIPRRHYMKNTTHVACAKDNFSFFFSKTPLYSLFFLSFLTRTSCNCLQSDFPRELSHESITHLTWFLFPSRSRLSYFVLKGKIEFILRFFFSFPWIFFSFFFIHSRLASECVLCIIKKRVIWHVYVGREWESAQIQPPYAIFLILAVRCVWYIWTPFRLNEYKKWVRWR